MFEYILCNADSGAVGDLAPRNLIKRVRKLEGSKKKIVWFLSIRELEL